MVVIGFDYLYIPSEVKLMTEFQDLFYHSEVYNSCLYEASLVSVK